MQRELEHGKEHTCREILPSFEWTGEILYSFPSCILAFVFEQMNLVQKRMRIRFQTLQQISWVICSAKKDAFITGKDGWDKKVKIKGYALYNFATMTTVWHKWIKKMNAMSWCNFLSTQSHIKSEKSKIKICSFLFCIWILSHCYIWIRNESKWK